jgi:hypothetical protein
MVTNHSPDSKICVECKHGVFIGDKSYGISEYICEKKAIAFSKKCNKERKEAIIEEK